MAGSWQRRAAALAMSGASLAMAADAPTATAPATPAASAPATTTAPAATQPVDWSGHILTPPPPPTPRINGPRVYGARPGAPFMYRVPATGEKPVTFAAEGLPDGLALDARTGVITGTSPAAPGTHKVRVTATNARGTDSATLDVVIGDRITLTPAMGWNSWNCWARAVDQEKVLRSARAMAASGLADHGWTYVNIDDAWQGVRSGPDRALQPDPKKFPDIKAMCDEIHAMGLKAGIYSSPWVETYAGLLGGSAENPEGTKQTWGKRTRNKKVLPNHVGKFSFAQADAKQWAAWGIDYVKYDWAPIEMPQVDEMDKALRATGRDMILSLSNNADGSVFGRAGDVSKVAQSWRTTTDINDSWRSLSSIGFTQDKWASFHGPGHWNDTDMLVVGYVGWGPKLHQTKLTADEQYTHISLWALLSAPLLIGCDLDRLDPFTLSLLTNDEVLAVDQDALGKQAVTVATQGDVRVYAKELADGTRAVGLFNLGTTPATGVANWSDLNLTGKQTIRDVWRQTDVATADGKYEAEIAPHGAVLLKLSPVKAE